ncbi:MAG: phenylacetate-CoA oxygenase subunit PaaJ [Actinobacteria bacterium]|nr:phenylacetate-CoA oxygenase subunit PaaJ [Actinomycetota bacterium]
MGDHPRRLDAGGARSHHLGARHPVALRRRAVRDGRPRGTGGRPRRGPGSAHPTCVVGASPRRGARRGDAGTTDVAHGHDWHGDGRAPLQRRAARSDRRAARAARPAPRGAVVNADAAAVVANVCDPEMPELTLGDLGIVRDVAVDRLRHRVTVTITPTFTGCPATSVMASDIETALHEAGWSDVVVRTVMTPAWTTDWITDAGRTKLAEAGIGAPPSLAEGFEHAVAAPVACPRCGSRHTRRQSMFGSSLCREAFVCHACREPFERIKPI